MSDRRKWTSYDYDYEATIANKCYGKSGPGMYFVEHPRIDYKMLCDGICKVVIPQPGKGLCIGTITQSPNGFIYEVVESEH